MKKSFYLIMMLVALFTTQVAMAQAPQATPAEAITALLNRIGGSGTADRFEIVIDGTLDDANGKDVFVITAQNGKPCIKGNNQLSVATGINWYLNHYAHINLTWNNLTTDLSLVTLPVPDGEEVHECNATYRYDFNTCTFSYSMAFWTWDRWQKEIDWMALHGINAPLNLVGLDVVTRNFLKELGVSDSDIAAYVAGPGFIAWFAMNNLEGWGGTINSSTTGVDMSGNPDWWYTRQEQLCKNMLQRMRELGMQPVIPGFSGQIPNSLSSYSITGFSSGDVINGGTWAGGYTRPDILHPNSSSYATLAPIYYKHLEAIMGVSEFYSMDPFHEGGLPDAVTNATCYPPIMAALDTYHNAVEDATKTLYNVSTEDNQAKWIIQYWQNIPQSGAFSSMESYGDRFIGLDLFSDNIYAGNAAKWRDTGNNCYYKGRPYIYCMLHNFGGRSGLHGRLETTMDGYFQALANNNNCQGIGATPEGTETNPILYDMLFELPWMDPNDRPTADEWLEEYAYSRYGVSAETAPNALAALQNLKESVWNCEVNQQGTSEAVILARPNWTINNVSSWSTSAIYWDTHDVRLAADQLISVAGLVTANGGKSGIANYNYDVIDVIRQAMVDFAAELLPLINAARGNDTEYTRLYQLYLQLMLDLDTMLSYDENFKLERWTSLARNIADEVTGTTENDRNWLEWNARTQVTVWSKGNTDLHDYSNRCWAGLIKDFHYWRWKYFFENDGGAPSGGWFSGFEYPWTVDFNDVYSYASDYSQIVIPTDMSATEKAAETFGKYFGRVKGKTSNYIFPMGVETNATKSDAIPEVYRGQTVELPLEIGKAVTVSSVQIDLNGDGAISNTEVLTADGMNVTIPDDAAIGKTKAIVEFSDGTVITFNLAIIVDITADRTVTAATADANMGTVAIEGTNELTITNQEAVKIIATANTGYNFKNWTDAGGNVVSNDNPYIYYGEGDASFTANFIQDKWGVVECNGSFSGDIASYAQFIHNLTFAYYNREAETILEATTAPTQIFNTIPQIIDVPQGASFTVKYDNGSSSGLQYCYFRAYIDLNADGDFDDEGELLKEVGTNGATNTAVCSNTMNVLLPYDAPLGITHMRLRFDGAWDNSSNPSGRGAKDPSIRPVYEIILNITDKTDKAAHVTVKTNSEEWGTVEVWTDETPDGSTGTEWDVSSNIPLYLRATKSTPDTEFLGWYDHYGRLLTTELEYTMYAREDATYTARFRKFLEIDGWQIEYRTEPGAMKTNKLASGVKPENGKTYYIYAPTRPTNDGDYVNRYLYNNNGTLSLNTTASGDNYLWTCSVDGENYTFRNVGDPAKYLAHKATAASPYNFKLGTGATQYEGITIYSVSADRFLVTKDDGTGFDQSNRAHNQSTEDYTTDYVFTEVSYPDNVILTNVRQSGDHDLEIPATVEILGEQCTIIGFDNGLFANNKDLWSISLPATIETMSNNRVFNAAIPGKGANQSADASNYIVTDLGTTCAPGEDWAISMTIEDNGNNFNQWGSALIATGNAPMNSTYANGFQLYMQSTSNGGQLIVKLDNDNNNNALASISKGTTYRIDIVYTHSNTQLVVTATSLESQASLAARRANATRTTNSLTLTQDMSGFSTVSHAIPEGVNITNLEVTKGAVPDPFEGCTNLMEMTVDGGNENYYVANRTLYTTGGTDLHELADEEKEEELRALGELIDNTDALIEQIATINPTGKATEIALSATQGDNGYIWCNAPQSGDEGNVSNLLDNTASTFFHSNWGSTTAPADGLDHHLTIELGEGNAISDFSFHYQARSGSGYGDYPKTIKVQGSNNGTDYTDIITVEPRNANGGTIENAAEWTSDVIGDGNKYTYLRFMVTATTTNKNKDGHIYWHMAEFDLYKVTSSAEVAPKYKNLAGVTNEETATVYDCLVEALYVYNNGGTADEMQAAYDALKPLYDALNDKVDNIFDGVYNINFGGVPVFMAYLEAVNDVAGANVAGYRLFDGLVEHQGASDGQTNDNRKEFHQGIIDAQAPADALFMIVPNANYTAYNLSVQGYYLENTSTDWWVASAFNNDKEQAGVYLFEDTNVEDVYKLKCVEQNNTWLPYINDWGYVFGNNGSDEAYATFTLTQVTEYTLNVPASGFTTLCLPFNVVLPAGVTAYDLAEANLADGGSYYTYELVTVASEGETLAKNTPVIVKATAGDYVLTITMNDEGAKASTAGTLLRSGLVKTTIEAGSKYTYDGENFNRVTAATEIAANQCWMELGESKGDIIYGETPIVLLTTDEENPVLYNIQVNRPDFYTPATTYLQYNEQTGVVNIAAATDNASYQAWYFMKGTDGAVLIKPYNGEGKVLGADDNGDGGTKVWAVENGTKNICEWTIEKNGEWYNILGDGKCFSNHGGKNSGTMGFYNDKGDGGSQFKFIPATFENDNSRFYQMKDLNALLPADKYIAGTSVGFYTEASVAAYTDSKAAATTLENATSASSSAADCYNAYKALRAADAAVEYITPDPAKVYYIVSAATNNNCTYCAGKYVYTLNTSATRGGNSYDHRHLVFDSFADITHKQLAAFQFEETGVVGEYKMKSLNSGLYVKSFAKNQEHLGTFENAAVVKISALANGQLILKIGNNAPMHAQDAGSVIVQWAAEVGNASTWIINEVADATAFNYTLTVPSSGIATLYLPFNVTLPEGVTAYTVDPTHILQKGDGSYYYDELTQVAAAGEKLAKGTAVIIKAAAGEYTFAATFDNTDAKTAAASALVGTYYKQTVSTGYSMAVENNEPIFVAITADTAVEPYNCWLVADGITTDKIGSNVEFQSVEIEDGKVYRIHGRLSSGALRTLYNNGAKNQIKWTSEAKSDASTLFVAQAGSDGKFTLASALANGYWNQDAKIEENGVELTFVNGSVSSTTMILGENERRFCADDKGTLNYYSDVEGDPASAYVNENVTTDFVFELVEDVTVSYTARIGKGFAYATLYLPYAVTVPDGVTAYIAHTVDVEGKVIQLTDLQGVIPAKTPVVLKRDATDVTGDYVFEYTTDETKVDLTDVNNVLTGYFIETLVEGRDDFRYYMLMKYNTYEKFYWILKEYDENGTLHTGVTTQNEQAYIKCLGNKAFLEMSELQASSSFSFQFTGTTGIDGVDAEGGNAESIYDLQGRKIVEITEKGVYIINGQKVVVE
ncbi:MAG: alpha-N-acetylglucosaminidase C-terminal domain-containing protein [Bacteroidaceae bacterium]|nr:alpha-N-acetylglucosaminidase C-terminal domain-containing protein [Bacteroidaceae bacterium]